MAEQTINWRAVQTRLGLVQDGVAGPKTWAALYAAAAGKPNTATEARGPIAAVQCAGYGLTTPARVAEFLAQTSHETGGFVRFEENLNYSAAAMLKNWPKHFTPAQAAEAVGKPTEIASRAYGGRMGNAAYPSKDGYTFRGRGDLQLTGRDNYRVFGQALGLDLIGHPELAAGPNGVRIALEFWRKGNVNAAVDAGNFTKARQITNGADAIGLADVAAIRKRLLAVLALPGCVNGTPIAAIPAACTTLLPDSWRTPVPGAPLPRTNATVGDWVAFGDAQTGQLDKANGRVSDSIAIVERCEARDAAAATKAKPKAFGIF